MPQGYRAKDQVAIKTYSGSSNPQSVFDWVNSNLASRVHTVHDIERLYSDWYRFQRKSEKVRVILISAMKIPPMFFSVLSVKFTGRVKFGALRLTDSEAQRDRLNVSKIPVYKIVTPEEERAFGSRIGEYLSYQSMALLLRTLHPEVNDIFLLSLVIVNLACFLELFITHGGPLKRLGRALWCIVKWNFLLILLWLPVLGLFQLPYIDAMFDHILTVLRIVGTTQFASCVRADWLWYSTVIGWLFLVVTFLAFALMIGWLHHLYGSPDVSSADDGLSRLWGAQWNSYFSTIFQPSSVSRAAWAQVGHARGTSEVGMELLIERLAVPNLWLQPIISSQYIHNLPIWKHLGPCRVDSDVGSDRESLSAAELDCPSDEASGGLQDSSVGWSSWFGQQRPLMFVCERCRALQTTIPARSEQELERERLESESACAKYLMDGNYRCMCGVGGGEPTSDGSEAGTSPHHRQCSQSSHQTTSVPVINSASSCAVEDISPALHATDGSGISQRHRHHSEQTSQSPQHNRTCRSEAPKPGPEEFTGIPPGIIAMTDCSICLENYKYGVVLCGLPCGHSFHQQCIMGWLSRDNHCCPVCRWPAYKAKPCNAHQHYD